jgi:hypothetical protein
VGIKPEELKEKSPYAILVLITKPSQLVQIVGEVALPAIFALQFLILLVKRWKDGTVSELQEGNDHAYPGVGT